MVYSTEGSTSSALKFNQSWNQMQEDGFFFKYKMLWLKYETALKEKQTFQGSSFLFLEVKNERGMKAFNASSWIIYWFLVMRGSWEVDSVLEWNLIFPHFFTKLK